MNFNFSSTSTASLALPPHPYGRRQAMGPSSCCYGSAHLGVGLGISFLTGTSPWTHRHCQVAKLRCKCLPLADWNNAASFSVSLFSSFFSSFFPSSCPHLNSATQQICAFPLHRSWPTNHDLMHSSDELNHGNRSDLRWVLTSWEMLMMLKFC